jgi:hypothetical protein
MDQAKSAPGWHDYPADCRPGTLQSVRALEMRVRPLTLAVIAVAAAFTISACSRTDDPSTHGPLTGAAPGGGNCSPARPGEGFTFGDELFKNTGHSTLVLGSVVLRDPRGLRLIGAYADPGLALVGAVSGWPPQMPPGDSLPENWKDRKPVPGFRLTPGKSFNMVIGVVAPRRPGGSTSGLVIRYHDAAGRYVVEDHFGYRVVTRRSC